MSRRRPTGRLSGAARRVRGALTPRRLAAALVLAGVLAGTGSGLARLRVHTDIGSFLPGDDASVSQMNTVDSEFGGAPVVALLESKQPKQLLDSSHLDKLLELEGELSRLPDVAVVYGPATVLNQIAGQAQDLLAELSGRRDAEQQLAEAQARTAGKSKAQIAAAGQKALTAFDARYGPLLITGLPVGLPTLSNAKFADSVIFSGQPTPRSQWRFVVPNAHSVAVLVRPRQGLDAAASERLVSAVRTTVASVHLGASRTTVSGAPVLVAALNSEVGTELPLLGGIAVAAVALCLFLVPWTRRSRRLLPLGSTLLAVAITLALYGWAGRSLSLGAVAALPVLMGVGSYYPTYFARRAATRTVFVVASGTAVSFATLAISPLPFVRDIALLLAVGVVVCAVVGWAVSRRLASADDVVTARPATVREPSTTGRVTAVTGLVVAACLAAAGWLMLPHLGMQTDFERYAQGLPALTQAEHAESVIGSSGELDITLTGKNVLSDAGYSWMRRAQNVAIAEYGDRIRPVVSAPTLMSFLGATPTSGEIDAGARFVPPYLLGATVTPSHDSGLISFGIDMSDLTTVHAVVAGLRAHLPKPPAGYTIRVVGLPVVAARGADLVSADRVWANVLGALAAAVILAIGLRRRRDAIRAMAAALVATGLGFSALWVSGLDLSPLTVCLGALTGAVACEFTVMLSDATRAADRRLRSSVALAVATSALGYLSLTASSLGAIREFGVMLACAVGLAFVSAWCVVRATVGSQRPVADTTSTAPPRRVLEGVGA